MLSLAVITIIQYTRGGRASAHTLLDVVQKLHIIWHSSISCECLYDSTQSDKQSSVVCTFIGVVYLLLMLRHSTNQCKSLKVIRSRHLREKIYIYIYSNQPLALASISFAHPSTKHQINNYLINNIGIFQLNLRHLRVMSTPLVESPFTIFIDMWHIHIIECGFGSSHSFNCSIVTTPFDSFGEGEIGADSFHCLTFYSTHIEHMSSHQLEFYWHFKSLPDLQNLLIRSVLFEVEFRWN